MGKEYANLTVRPAQEPPTPRCKTGRGSRGTKTERKGLLQVYISCFDNKSSNDCFFNININISPFRRRVLLSYDANK
jgi:hypothetical protein